MKKVLVLFCLVLPLVLSAEEVRVEYSSFYSHIRKLDTEDLNALQFSFGFKKVGSNRLCAVSNAHIHTQKKSIPVSVNSQNRFTLPNEKALKMAKAEVVVELTEPANQCDMSVQLETKQSFLKNHYTNKELQLIYQQYQNFFDEMGGFLSFLMPSAIGLNFLFDEPVKQAQTGLVIENKTVTMDASWLAENTGVTWDQKPIRITSVTSD